MKTSYLILFLLFINATFAQNSQTHNIEPAPEENHWFVKNFLGNTLNYRIEYYCNEALNDSNFFALYTNGKLFLDGDLVHYFTSGKEKIIIPYKQNKVDGIYKEFYHSGKLKQKSTWKKNKRHGSLVLFREDGSKKIETNFSDGFKEGKEIVYYPNGNEKAVLNYTKGLLHGWQKSFKPNGRMKKEYYYENNNDASLEGLSEEEYLKAPKLIEFPIDVSKIELFLINSDLPDYSKKDYLQKIHLNFLVGTDGKVKKILNMVPYSEENFKFFSQLLNDISPLDTARFDDTPIEYHMGLDLYFLNGIYIYRKKTFNRHYSFTNDFGKVFWKPYCYFEPTYPGTFEAVSE